MSHGQATIEGGLSVNIEVTVENISERSLTAQTLIIDTVRSGPEDIEITNGLLIECSSAGTKYHSVLEDIRRLKLATRKRAATEELLNMKSKR